MKPRLSILIISGLTIALPHTQSPFLSHQKNIIIIWQDFYDCIHQISLSDFFPLLMILFDFLRSLELFEYAPTLIRALRLSTIIHQDLGACQILLFRLLLF